MAKTSTADKELLNQVANHFNLKPIFRDEIKSWEQAQVLAEIQKQCQIFWHENYIQCNKKLSPNPAREYDSMTGALSTLISQLENMYSIQEQDMISELKNLQERLLAEKRQVDTSIQSEVQDYYFKQAKQWMEVAEFSKTKIKELKPIIRKMIKEGK